MKRLKLEFWNLGESRGLFFYCTFVSLYNHKIIYRMKKLFMVAMLLFTTSIVFGSPPQYDVGDKDIGVYVDNVQDDGIVKIATVNIETQVVQNLSTNIKVFVSAHKTNNGNLAILTKMEDYQFLYVSKHFYREQVPDEHKRQIVYSKYNIHTIQRLNHTSGGLPYPHC